MIESDHFSNLSVACEHVATEKTFSAKSVYRSNLWRAKGVTRALLHRYAGVLLLLSVLPSQLQAQMRDDVPARELKLIELFTSHGCSSCPDADTLLGELLDEDDELLALEFHVDYWDTLVHGADGSFTDPFSSASHSERQRAYNSIQLAGRPGVYTPQMIVNGRFATVGSNRWQISRRLDEPGAASFDIRIVPDQGKLRVEVFGTEQRRKVLEGTDIAIYRYLDKVQTPITGGENSGKTLTNHHVVTALTLLGEITVQGEMSFSMDTPGEGEGCVVLIQEGALTPVYAAVSCP